MNWEMTYGVVLFVMAVCIVLIIVIIVRQMKEKKAEEEDGVEESSEVLVESALEPDSDPLVDAVAEPLAVPVAEMAVEQSHPLPEVEPTSTPASPLTDKKYYLLLYRDSATDKLGIELPTKNNILDKSQLTSTELMMVRGFYNKLKKWLDEVPEEKEEKKQSVLPANAPIAPINIQSSSKKIENPMNRSIFSLGQEDLSEASLPSIASQINAVLQNILIQENYQGKGFYLTDNADGDLVVVIGTEKFVGVDNVPDPAIEKLIRRAADLWTDQNLRRKG